VAPRVPPLPACFSRLPMTQPIQADPIPPESPTTYLRRTLLRLRFVSLSPRVVPRDVRAQD